MHTEGPLDGSLYATVIKKAAAAGASPRSQSHPHPHGAAAGDSHELHTVSMDSGISSSGRERLSGGSSHSPSGPHSGSSARSAPCDSSPLAALDTSPRAQPARAPLSVTVETSVPSRVVKKQSSVDASQLDELLSGLLENCSNIRDLRPCQTPAPDIDTIQTPTFEAPPALLSSARATPTRARTVSTGSTPASAVARGDADSSGYASTQSPSQPPLASTSSSVQPSSNHGNNMVHYNGYKTERKFSESFSSKGESEEIPYHARADSKPFSYANFGGGATRRSPSPAGLRQTSPENRVAPEVSERRPSQLESPRLVRKLLVGGSPSPAASKPTPTPPSPSLPRKQYTNGSTTTTVKESYSSSTANRSPSADLYGRASSGANDIYSKPYNISTLKSNTTDTLKSLKSQATDTLPSQRSYNTDTMKSYNTDTMRSNTSFNTDTLKSNRSYDWESTIRSTAKTPATPPAPPGASSTLGRAVEPYRRPAVPTREVDLVNRNDPNAKTVTTYDQNTNSMTTVSTQSFDVPCSPNPTRKIVETTKRYVVDDEDGRKTGVTKMEETVREFVIEDLP